MAKKSKKEPKQKSAYGLKWVFGQTKGNKHLWFFYTLTQIGLTVGNIVMAFVLKQYVDFAMGDTNLAFGTIMLMTGGLIAYECALLLLSMYLRSMLSGKMERNLRGSFLNAIFTKNMRGIAKYHTGEMQTRLTADVTAVCEIPPNISQNILSNVISIILATIACFTLSWQVSLVVFIVMPVLLGIMAVFTPIMQKTAKTDKENDEEHRTFMQEALSRLVLIKTYFMREKTVAKSDVIYAKKIKSAVRLGLWQGFATFSGNLVASAIFIAVIGYGSYLVFNGSLTIGAMITLVQLMNFIINPIANLSGHVAAINQGIASAARIGEIFDAPRDEEYDRNLIYDASGLCVNGVSFAYEEGDNVFTGIDAEFKKGSITGIIGKSGVGKSTLLKLLIGLFPAAEGSVELASPTKPVKNGAILPQIAYVPPSDYLFAGSVRENIIMSGAENPELLRQCAGEANILEFVEGLPQGFDTMLGESGGTVSSGQAQRIAIARALYKKAPVIVFDEPTANLDIESVERFRGVVKSIAKDHICIVVTHDPGTMKICDYVYAIGNGRIAEQGAPDEISAAEEIFA
ncbi:MAG: ABC transporter ATP-binding protein/permease [Defluviitaleaceae bacterium]|nr:ABC transporter ATP-binding protein/permease [Defluviitaleaceae bacterium]MCL2836854.1 ABC transporter ATP-binding protein/permease [Defluviitaleaceae bacterium]